MSKLEEYQKKRKFDKTPEPSGSEKPKNNKKGLIYVIQEHHASHLHWDLRLEEDGVLKSWAIPKEPSTDPKVKRLAVQTEDHPIEYATFEGTIPEGHYGAGTVKIWDSGTYELIEKNENKYVVNIHGKKLKGIYYLIYFKPRWGVQKTLTGKEEKKNWLFFKKKEKQ